MDIDAVTMYVANLNEINNCEDTVVSQFDSNGCWAQCKKKQQNKLTWHFKISQSGNGCWVKNIFLRRQR